VKKLSILLFATFIAFGCANNNEANDKPKVDANDQVLMNTSTHDANGLVWYTNVEKAIAVAKEENKPVLLQFSGSDGCKYCILLNNEVLFTKEFADYAKDNLILVNLDNLRKSPQAAEVVNYNRAQMRKYGIQGYPTVLLLDKDGNVVLQTGYKPGGPTAYIAHIKEAYGMK
jgi:thioredoxin-related protein